MSQEYMTPVPAAPAQPLLRHSITQVLHLDFPMLMVLLCISAYGLLVLYSATQQDSDILAAQAVKVLLGLVIMLVIAQMSPIFLRRVAPWAFAGGLLLLVLSHLIGVEVNGSRRWLRIPGLISFQPSEFMKLCLPLILAWYFHDRHLPPRLHHIFWSLLMILSPLLLIAFQPDLGTSLIVAASGIFVLLLAGTSWRLVIGALTPLVLAAPALWFALRDYQRQRILTLLDPDSDPLGAGWSIAQSKIAIGSGGIWGKGLFQGTQSNLEFLPEIQTDFIISVMAEEFGLIGVLLLLGLYLLLIGRCLVLSVRSQDTFGLLLSTSLTFTFFVYVFVNIGMVSGILPVVGVPLPLVSYGGTSMLTLFAGFGILMSVYSHRRVLR